MYLLAAIVGVAAVFLVVQLVRECNEGQELKPRRNMSRFISDEEFLAACSVKDPAVALKIRAIIAEQLDFPVNNIHPDDRLIHDLGAW